MKVLVTGGTGLVGSATVDALVRSGHQVRLLSRHADEDARRWPHDVESRPGDVTSDERVRGAADGCDAVVHTVGLVGDERSRDTLHGVNVQGTVRIAREAKRAGVARFVYVSSLGAERGRSAYHRSKREAEARVREEDPPGWLIVRPGNVYGPGDEVISLLLRMVRSLPVVPTVGWGDQAFQPIWHEDLGEALARAVTSDSPARTSLDLAGPEVTTTHELLELISELTGSSAPRVPIPEFLARLGTRAAEVLGLDLPVKESQITMLLEGNVLPRDGSSALIDVFHVTPTPLRTGLTRLLDSLPEQLPAEGRGPMRRERFWADVEGSTLSADALFQLVQDHFAELPPNGLVQVGAEPNSPVTLRVGNTLSLAVPMRGHVQVRVAEIENRTATLVTVSGHFLAGVIRFLVRAPDPSVHPDEVPSDGRLRFEVRSYTRAATLPDLVAMRTVGVAAQIINWSTVVQEVVRRSGGAAPDGVERELHDLDEHEAARVERWIDEMVLRLKRAEAP